MTQEELDLLKKEFQTQIDGLKSKSVEKSEIESLETKYAEMLAKTEKAATTEEVEKLTTEITTLKEAAHQLNEKFEKRIPQKNEKKMSLKSAISELVGGDDFKEQIRKNRKTSFDLDVKTGDFVQKIDSADFDGDEYRSQLKPGITFSKLTENTIAPIFNMVTVPAGKDRIVWLEGSATVNVGYVEEGSAATSDSEGSTTLKARNLAKISAKMPFTTEALDMPESFASRMQRRMVEATNVWLDNQMINGAGDDSTDPGKIYGLISKGATAFSAPSDLDFTNANIDDLIDACMVQASPYKPTHCIMNLKSRVKYSRVKDSTGQYVIREVNGLLMLGGLQLVISEGMSDGELLVVDRSTLEFWVKQGMRMIVTQMDGTDISEDKWKAILFWRGQTLVETPQIVGNIYVSDIDTALAAIETVTG